MVHHGKRPGVAVRVVVESALCPPRYARAAVCRRLLPDREPTLAAKLHRREQVIPAARRVGFRRGPGASRDPSRAPDGAAYGAHLPGVFRSCDAEPMAAL